MWPRIGVRLIVSVKTIDRFPRAVIRWPKEQSFQKISGLR